MSKILSGKVVSVKSAATAVILVEKTYIHPLYHKRVRKTKKYLIDTTGQTLELGESVKAIETRPISKRKFFKLLEKIKDSPKE